MFDALHSAVSYVCVCVCIHAVHGGSYLCLYLCLYVSIQTLAILCNIWVTVYTGSQQSLRLTPDDQFIQESRDRMCTHVYNIA